MQARVWMNGQAVIRRLEQQRNIAMLQCSQAAHKDRQRKRNICGFTRVI